MKDSLAKQPFYYKFFVFLALFIFALSFQFLIFQFVIGHQYFVPHDFLEISEKILFFLSLTLMIAKILGAVINQILTRIIGLKKTILIALFFNFLATVCLFSLSLGIQSKSIIYFIIFLKTSLAGITISMILVSFIAYVIFEMPKGIGGGLLLMIAFMNTVGYLIYPFLIEMCTTYKLQYIFLFMLFFLSFISIIILNKLLISPPLPKRFSHLKKGSLI